MARILIIDDDKMLRYLLTEYLQDDYEVRVAADGLIGIEIAQEYLPDLIICDIAMPNMDGFSVLRHLQTLDTLADVPFIFLSGNSDKEVLRQSRALGADDFVMKPFDVDELLEVVHARLEKRQRRQALVNKAIDELRLNITTALPHELRTAIMIMEGYAMLVLENASTIDPVQQEMLSAIRDNAMRLRNMAEKYIWYLRAFLPNAAIQAAHTNTPDMIIQTAAFDIARRFNRVADLQLQLATAMVQVSDEYLGKIAEEIIENAFKFSRPGTPVIIVGDVQAPMYTLTVSDFGREMSADEIERVGAFMQFNRALYEQQGTGLGLIIAKRLVELSGGTLSIKSAETQTSIAISVPLVYEPLAEPVWYSA